MKKLNKYLKVTTYSFGALILLRLYAVAFVVQPVYKLTGDNSKTNQTDQILDEASSRASIVKYIDIILIAVFLISLAVGIWKHIQERKQSGR